MQFSTLLLGAAACAIANAVQFTMTASQFVSVTAGTPFNISWTGASGPVTLLLKNGAASDLKDVATISSGLTGTTFIWTPSTSLPAGTYALEITDSSNIPNYSQQFTLASSTVSSSSVSSSSTGSSSSASSTSSSASSSSASTVTSTSSTSSTATPFSNSTSSSSSASKTSSSSKTGTTTTSSSATGTSAPPNNNSAAGIASPLAFILLAFAAIMTLN